MTMEQLPGHIEATRYLCQEASSVLSSLRSGPPAVAHGDLVQDLRILRKQLKTQHLTLAASSSESVVLHNEHEDKDDNDNEDEDDFLWTISPFLAVVMDPICSGRHTLCALRAVHRLLERGTFVSLVKFKFGQSAKRLSLDVIAKAVLDCKFEQTDISGDEAVEMALADLLGLLIVLDSVKLMSMDSTISDSVQSNSLPCAHDFISPLQSKTRMSAFTSVFVARNTFIHSPALCYHVEGVLQNMISATFRDCMSVRRTSAIEDAARTMLEFLVQQLLHTPLNISDDGNIVVNEAQTLHDATRVLCLKLIRCLVREGWGSRNISNNNGGKSRRNQQDENSRPLLGIIQDELCLALLIIGQAAGGIVLSLEVLSEVCSTILCLWGSSLFLRQRLYLQFEAIISGFFVRALSQLRQRQIPIDSSEFTKNQSFDAECEIILETLVDMMCLVDESNTSALEVLFLAYDCNLNSSNVVVGLVDELSKCSADVGRELSRQIPAHLRELCAEALTAGFKCMLNEFASIESKVTTSSLVLREMKFKKSTMLQGAILFNEKPSKGIQFLIDQRVIQCTPKDVALFLRQGITLGLSKVSVGGYLGEKGKGSNPLKAIPEYERDWFHNKVLQEYCSLFYFEAQPLLDGLRMFLSSFRLPGEAQQIDRIIQAFAESCGGQCKETVEMNLFSENKKKATDATYLLAFSIIMLNTDLHNPNIRSDRKMSLDAFFKNNTDYGREITDEGKALPMDFLETIYESIKLEEIRTEGEGAEGIMTVDQWNDVVIGRRGGLRTLDYGFIQHQCEAYPRQVKEFVIEYIWQPVLDAVEGFWKKEVGINEGGSNGMLGSQEARLGMDLALELLIGIHEIGNEKIFNTVFVKTCELSGLLQYCFDENEQRNNFIYSVQKQSAVIVVMSIAQRAGNFINMNGWKALYSILFELRDLKLLNSNVLTESEADFLNYRARDEWNVQLIALNSHVHQNENDLDSSGVFGTVFGSLFSSSDHGTSIVNKDETGPDLLLSVHGKEKYIIWNERAESDDESEGMGLSMENSHVSSGMEFENMLLQEDHFVYLQAPTKRNQEHVTQRARVRKRLAIACDFHGLISESKFFNVECIQKQIHALIDLISGFGVSLNRKELCMLPLDSIDETTHSFDVSPASEAYAEILITEILLKNRDRLEQLLNESLHQHYIDRLSIEDGIFYENEFTFITPGIEKCIVGLLRLCCRTIQRGNITEGMMRHLELLTSRYYCHFSKHFAEGCWRMCTANCDGMKEMSKVSWSALFKLLDFCALSSVEIMKLSTDNLVADDPALITFRIFHVMLHSPDLNNSVPFEIVYSIKILILCGDKRSYSQLTIASLDLLLVLHSRLGAQMTNQQHTHDLLKFWVPVLECMKEASISSPFTAVRQHALSMLTDSIIDSHGKLVPQCEIFRLLNSFCIELATERISSLINHEDMESHINDVNIELDLCLGLIFKPFLHHLHVQNLTTDNEKFELLWFKLLDSVKPLLGDEGPDEYDHSSLNNHHDSAIFKKVRRSRLLESSREGATERLQNVIMVMIGYNILLRSDANHDPGSISDTTWKSIRSLKFCCSRIDEWVLLENESGSNVHVSVVSSNLNLVAQ